MLSPPFGRIDCFGMTRSHPDLSCITDRFMVADLRTSFSVRDGGSSETGCRQLLGPSRGQLMMVADGVGDRANAACASSIVADAFDEHLMHILGPKLVDDQGQPDWREIREGLVDTIAVARKKMQRRARLMSRSADMGAVVTLAYIDWPNVRFLHVGNNRAYHIRNKRVVQVTEDHTMANRLVEAGKMTPNRADRSQLRNVICNLIGTQADTTATPESIDLRLRVGDSIVLTTDGSASALDRRQIAEALEFNESAEDACHELLGACEDAGVKDDATVVIARFVSCTSGEKLADVLRSKEPAEEAWNSN